MVQGDKAYSFAPPSMLEGSSHAPEALAPDSPLVDNRIRIGGIFENDSIAVPLEIQKGDEPESRGIFDYDDLETEDAPQPKEGDDERLTVPYESVRIPLENPELGQRVLFWEGKLRREAIVVFVGQDYCHVIYSDLLNKEVASKKIAISDLYSHTGDSGVFSGIEPVEVKLDTPGSTRGVRVSLRKLSPEGLDLVFAYDAVTDQIIQLPLASIKTFPS